MTIIDKTSFFGKKKNIRSSLEYLCMKEGLKFHDLNLVSEQNGPKMVSYLFYQDNNGKMIQLNYHQTTDNNDFIDMIYPIKTKKYNFYTIFTNPWEVIEKK